MNLHCQCNSKEIHFPKGSDRRCSNRITRLSFCEPLLSLLSSRCPCFSVLKLMLPQAIVSLTRTQEKGNKRKLNSLRPLINWRSSSETQFYVSLYIAFRVIPLHPTLYKLQGDSECLKDVGRRYISHRVPSYHANVLSGSFEEQSKANQNFFFFPSYSFFFWLLWPKWYTGCLWVITPSLTFLLFCPPWTRPPTASQLFPETPYWLIGDQVLVQWLNRCPLHPTVFSFIR